MAEWLKAHAWKACVRETVPWVRIPLSPPGIYCVRPGDMGDRIVPKTGRQSGAERIVEGLQGILLQVEISQIIGREADEPNVML